MEVLRLLHLDRFFLFLFFSELLVVNAPIEETFLLYFIVFVLVTLRLVARWQCAISHNHLAEEVALLLTCYF